MHSCLNYKVKVIIILEEVMSLSQPTFMGNSITVVLHPKTGVVIYRSRYFHVV